jgi:hypothetical protein
MEAHRKGWRCWFAASSYVFLWHVVILKVGFQSALALALRGSTEFIGGFKEARIQAGRDVSIETSYLLF